MTPRELWTSRMTPEDLYWQDRGTTADRVAWERWQEREWYRQAELERMDPRPSEW